MEKFSDKFTKKFISMMQDNECLYDMTKVSCRNKPLKDKAWQDIANTMNIDGGYKNNLKFLNFNQIRKAALYPFQYFFACNFILKVSY